MNPPNNQPHDEPMATLATVSSMAQAEAMRMELELSGIRVEIDGQHAANVLPIASNAFGGIPVQVPTADLKRAREVLSNRMRLRDKGIYECPRCHSDNIAYQNNARRQMPLMLMSLMFPPLFLFLLYIRFAERNREEYQCRNCRHEWVEARKKKSSQRFLRA